MKLTKRCPLTGGTYTMDIPLSEEEYEAAHRRWKHEGVLAQNAFPTLKPSEREFIMTGISPEVWAAMVARDLELYES